MYARMDAQIDVKLAARTDAQIDVKLDTEIEGNLYARTDASLYVPIELWLSRPNKQNITIISTPDRNYDEWKKIEIELSKK